MACTTAWAARMSRTRACKPPHNVQGSAQGSVQGRKHPPGRYLVPVRAAADSEPAALSPDRTRRVGCKYAACNNSLQQLLVMLNGLPVRAPLP